MTERLILGGGDEAEADAQQRRLVAIDDEAELLGLIARAAEGQGFKVESTTEPELFKGMIRAGSPTIIMLDLQMPKCDGIELLRFLAEEKCPSVIILVSGVDSRVLSIARGVGERLGLKMGAALQKPIRIAELRSAMRIASPTLFRVTAESLHHAFEADQLTLHYQPLVDLRDSRLVGWEALARWNHPELGLVMPDRFIPVAEREGLIGRLTDRVLELATAQLSEWRRRDGQNLFVSVNISAGNLNDPRLPDRLEQLCAERQVSPDLLRLELTETAAMGDAVRLIEVLTRFRLKGFKLAIDDFGTGYSSLLQLHRLPFSELKIDRMFVCNMATSGEASIIVGAIINLAHSLGLELIAEGVENEDLAARLTAAGCELGQGYYFGRPMPAEDVPAWRAGRGKNFKT